MATAGDTVAAGGRIGLLDKSNIIAPPDYNRWLVPPAALAIHLCIGMAYGFSVFWLPLGRAVGVFRVFYAPDGVTYLTLVFSFATTPDPSEGFRTWPAAVSFLAHTFFADGGYAASVNGRSNGYRRKRTGPEVLAQGGAGLGAVYVAVSTGGTLAGIAMHLRAVGHPGRIVAVDLATSAVTGTPTAAPRLIPGIGASQPSFFLRPWMYDGVARVTDGEAIALCRMLLDLHGGEVPRSREALEALPGVGRKTANVILNTAFGEPTIAVDTHIFRVSNRTGLAPGANVRIVEDKLARLVPEEFRLDAHHWLILHGRYTCKARTPDCPHCPIRDLCRYLDKTPGPWAFGG